MFRKGTGQPGARVNDTKCYRLGCILYCSKQSFLPIEAQVMGTFVFRIYSNLISEC